MAIRKIHPRLAVGTHKHVSGGVVRVWTEEVRQGAIPIRSKKVKFFEHLRDGKLLRSGVLSGRTTLKEVKRKRG